MSIYSGKDGYVNGIGCIQSWSAAEAVTAQRFSASCVSGATAVPSGIVNWTGQITGVGAYPSAVLPTGIDFSFQGVINNTALSLKSLTGTALIEQLTIDIDKSTYAPIKWTATYGVQGVLTEAASSAADSTVNAAENGKDLSISIDDVTLTQSLTKAQIIFKRPHTTYVDGGVTKRVAGNLECDVSFGVQDSSVAVAAYAKNVLASVKIYTTATDYWFLALVRFLGKSDFQVDRVANNVLGYTVNGQWSGADNTEPGFISYVNGGGNNDFYGTSS